MDWESFGVVTFDSQTRIPKLKSAYSSHIIGPRGLQFGTNL